MSRSHQEYADQMAVDALMLPKDKYLEEYGGPAPTPPTDLWRYIDSLPHYAMLVWRKYKSEGCATGNEPLRPLSRRDVGLLVDSLHD